mmetsp:Transcript_94096/g.173161  ORF Transcript_94096/g.173161 Transcript_94096/m.173161 type:complete len:205 (+) Transcript_94096:495-1109(+)
MHRRWLQGLSCSWGHWVACSLRSGCIPYAARRCCCIVTARRTIKVLAPIVEFVLALPCFRSRSVEMKIINMAKISRKWSRQASGSIQGIARQARVAWPHLANSSHLGTLFRAVGSWQAINLLFAVGESPGLPVRCGLCLGFSHPRLAIPSHRFPAERRSLLQGMLLFTAAAALARQRRNCAPAVNIETGAMLITWRMWRVQARR